jgi:predicted nucleic acid-binding protein
MKKTETVPALLDVNFLIALMLFSMVWAGPAHEFHLPAHEWFRKNRRFGWATCRITENGCLRILSRPGYPVTGLASTRLRDMLAEFTRLAGHQFWPDSVSLLEADRFDLSNTGSKALTDLYLLRLAAASGGRLVTFDRTIRWQAVKGCGAGHVEVLAA